MVRPTRQVIRMIGLIYFCVFCRERDLAIDSSRFPEGARLSDTNKAGERNCVWFSGYPAGYLKTIRWMHARDTSADILLTENGWCGNATIENADQLWYFQTYLEQVYNAIQEGIPIIGYTAWSLMDNYEWGSYQPRFGLFYVDFPKQAGSHKGYVPEKEDLKRIPRPAAHFIAHVAQSNCLHAMDEEITKAFPPQPIDIPLPPNWSFWYECVFVVVLLVALVYIMFTCIRRCYQRSSYTPIPQASSISDHEV